jgi:S-phase kinase-associated protein 1
MLETSHACPAKPLAPKEHIKMESLRKMSEWEQKYMDELNEDQLFDLTMGANFLDFYPLLDLCAHVIAMMGAGRTTEELREIFGLVSDFEPEEEERVRKEKIWMDD